MERRTETARRGNDFVRIARAIAAGARTAQFLVINSTTYRDSIVCKRWDKKTQAATGPEVFVAKPFECQRSPYESRTIDGVFYNYTSHLRRTASKNNVQETQVVTVAYVNNQTRISAIYLPGGVLDEYPAGSEAPIAVSWWEVSHRCFAAEAEGTQVATATAGVVQGGGIQHNFGADRNPLVTDDSAAGYGEGSMWNNVVASTSWMCINPAAGLAVWVELTGGGGGVSDGDKGDITVTGSGATWTIDPATVTLAKMADVASDRLIGRDTAGSGVPEALTVGGGVEFTGSGGIQRSALTGDATAAAGSNATVLATKLRTVSKIIYIESPTATDEFPIGHVPDAATMVRVVAVTDVGTVDFNIEKRAQLTPDVAGTNIWTVDKQATAAGLNQTGFDSGAVSADNWLHYSASAVASAPTKLWVTLEYTID